MTIEEANAILTDKKSLYWSHQRQQAEETAKEVVRILSEFSEVGDAKRFINKMLKEVSK